MKKAAEYAAKLEREKSADASELLESFKKLQRQREELLSEQNAHSLERAKAESEAAEAEKELARIKSDGEKIADTVKKQEEKIRNALGVSEIPDFAALEKNLHKQRKELQDSLELFTKKCEDLKRRYGMMSWKKQNAVRCWRGLKSGWRKIVANYRNCWRLPVFRMRRRRRNCWRRSRRRSLYSGKLSHSAKNCMKSRQS